MPPKLPPLVGGDDDDFDNGDDFWSTQRETIEVATPSGATINVLTEEEATFYKKIAERYQEDNKFKNISDLLELDRVLALEVMCFRLTTWQLQESTYDGTPLPVGISKEVNTLSTDILKIKSGLGIDKKTRDAGRGDSIAELFENLRIRAKEFGIHRNEQLYTAWRNWNGLEALITAHRNSTDTERTEFGYHFNDILAWCDERFEELHKIDLDFQEEQRIWIRDIS